MPGVPSGEAGVLPWFDQAGDGKNRDGEMPRVHGSKGMLPYQREGSLLDLVLVGRHHGHRAIHPEVPVEHIEKPAFVASPGPGRTHQGARDLDPRPGTGDQGYVGIL